MSFTSTVFLISIQKNIIVDTQQMLSTCANITQWTHSQAFANPEDAKKNNVSVVANDPDVERVRRAHLNDLENILPFLALCPLYLATGPSPWLATNLIRTFGIARAAHSFFYLNEVGNYLSPIWIFRRNLFVVLTVSMNIVCGMFWAFSHLFGPSTRRLYSVQINFQLIGFYENGTKIVD